MATHMATLVVVDGKIRYPTNEETYRFFHPNGTAKYAKQCINRLMNDHGKRLKLEIERLRGLTSKVAEEKLEITAERILAELGSLAFLDPADFYDNYGNLKSIHDMPQTARAALTGIESEEGNNGVRTKKIKHEGKLGALTLLVKLKDMMPKERVDITSGGKSLGLSDEERAEQLAAIRQAIQERKGNGN